MSAKAKMLSLEMLHNLTALQLTEILTTGVPVFDPEGNETGRVPASAAYFATAIKFLKDNGITAELVPDSPLAGLVSSLPTFDDEDELPVRRN